MISPALSNRGVIFFRKEKTSTAEGEEENRSVRKDGRKSRERKMKEKVGNYITNVH